MSRALVVGAGLAGLAAAVELAMAGRSVLVLEAGPRPGGMLQGFHRGARAFPTGFHFATGAQPGGPFRRLLQRLELEPRWQEPVAFHLHLDEGLLVLPPGLGPAEAALAARFPAQAQALARFFVALRTVLASSAWLGGAGSAAARLPTGSAAAVIDACGLVGGARQALLGVAAILPLPPETTPFPVVAAVLGSALAGSWRLVGGGEALSGTLRDRLRSLGGELRSSCAAERVCWQERRAQAVEDAAGVRHEAEAVILACHPGEARRLLGPGGLRPALAGMIAEAGESAGALAWHGALAEDPGLGSDCHLLWDGGRWPLLAAAHGAALEVLRWTPLSAVPEPGEPGRRHPAYLAWKEVECASLRAAARRVLPGLDRLLTGSWSGSPRSGERWIRSPGGACGPLCHAWPPHPARSKLRNLGLCGQGLAAPGALGALIGAAAAVQACGAPSLPLGGLKPAGRAG